MSSPWRTYASAQVPAPWPCGRNAGSPGAILPRAQANELLRQYEVSTAKLMRCASCSALHSTAARAERFEFLAQLRRHSTSSTIRNMRCCAELHPHAD